MDTIAAWRDDMRREDHAILEVEVVGEGSLGARLFLPVGIATPHDEAFEVSVETGAVEAHATAAGLAFGALLAHDSNDHRAT